jgi:hypothetical protein
MKNTRLNRHTALSVLPVVLAAACGSQSSDETSVETAAAAVVQAPALPCDARGTAITAVTGNVTLNGGVIDSYQSSLGGYGGANVGANGNVVAKGNILLQNHGVINGTQTAHASPNMPLPAVPTAATKLPLGSSQPGSININGVADSITLAPGVYVVRDLSINSPGALRISGNAPVTVFVTNSLNLGGNVNLNGIPSNLTFIMTKTGTVAFNSNGRLFGNIYAPTSSVTLNSPVFGYVVGSSVTLNSGSSAHYDLLDACVGLPNPNTTTKTNPTYGSLSFTVRLASGEQLVEILIRRNGVLTVDKDITSSEAPIGDGTSIYSYTLSGVADGDQIDYRFHSKLPGGADTFTPGPSQGWSTVCEAFDQCHAGSYDAVNNVCVKSAKANGAACNDGNACTKTDTCQAGACTGSNPVVCAATDQCHSAGTCDPALGCSSPSLPDGTACNDNSGCTTGDVCKGGICAGTVDTSPSNPACLGQNQGFGNPTHQPHALPYPPLATGCYAGTRDGTWLQLPCDPDPMHNHRMEVSNDGLEVPPASRANVSYVFGQAETTIIHTDSQVNVDPGSPNENDSWSMQLNTNSFTSSATDTGFVQFIFGKWPDTAHPGNPANSRICAYPVTWKTGMDPATTGDYNSHIRCIAGGSTIGLPAMNAGKFSDFDYVNLAGFAYDDNSSPPQHMLATVVQYSMVPNAGTADALAVNQIPGLYAVVAPDIGLAGNWFVATGGVMGKADSAAAQFTNGEVLTTISASNCPGDTSATGVTCPSLPALSTAGSTTAYVCSGFCTGESDNLTEVHAPGLSFPNQNLAVTQVLASDHTSGGTPACLAGLSDDVFVKDNDADEGGIPSNSGGVPFWESPDIFILPATTPPAPPQLNDVAADFQVTLGQDYDVYLRVNNDFGCNDVSNLQVIIDGADPSIGFANWSPITAGADTNQFVAAPGNPTVPKFGKAILGPFPWSPSTALAGGHKCLRAAVVGGNQAFPFTEGVAGDWPEAFASHQIAQRNIQVTNGSNCDYSIDNPSSNAVNALLGINVTPASSLAGSTINLTFDDDASFDWFAIWSQQAARLPANTLTVAKGTGATPTTILTLNTSSIALDTVSVAAGASPNVHIDIATTASPAPKVAISARLEDPKFHTILVENGGSCQPTHQSIVECEPGLTFCGETCVDLSTDDSNCGSCGNVCVDLASCFGGECIVIG